MDGSELHWAAFRYAIDELEGDELREFEGLLDSDQGAREALAAAVGLAASVRRAEGSRASIPMGRSARWRWAVAGVAAAALVAVALTARPRTPEPDLSADAQSLALAWLDLRADAEAAEPVAGAEGADMAVDEPEGMEIAAEPFAELAEDSPPAWLFEAAEAYAERGGV